jgi:hypothetical protein
MADPVFANSMQISSKAMGGKSICQFPDVCFTPPLTPATPPGVPIPYPNTGMAGDTTDGSSSVKIGGEEVMLKDRSSFKQSTGDEAGATPKKGLINSKLKGKVYFLAWSMDVKIEGENVVRNLDMTTHNHASNPANGAVPTVHVATAALQAFPKCGGDSKKIKKNCNKNDNKDKCPGVLSMKVGKQRAQFDKATSKRSDSVKKWKSKVDEGESRTVNAAEVASAEANSSPCVKAMRCFLRPFKPNKGEAACCPGQTPHHIPPKECMRKKNGKFPKNYKVGAAKCVCMEGAGHSVGSHGKNHSAINHFAGKMKMTPGSTCSTKKYNRICAIAVAVQCGCDPACIEQQLNDSMKTLPEDTEVTHKNIGAGLDAKEAKSLNTKYAELPKRKTR